MSSVATPPHGHWGAGGGGCHLQQPVATVAGQFCLVVNNLTAALGTGHTPAGLAENPGAGFLCDGRGSPPAPACVLH